MDAAYLPSSLLRVIQAKRIDYVHLGTIYTFNDILTGYTPANGGTQFFSHTTKAEHTVLAPLCPATRVVRIGYVGGGILRVIRYPSSPQESVDYRRHNLRLRGWVAINPGGEIGYMTDTLRELIHRLDAESREARRISWTRGE